MSRILPARLATAPAFLACLLILSLFAASPTRAGLCSLDDVPAATLLLPYFEVDLDRPTAMTTLFSVSNASADPVLAKITLWSELAIPTLNFDIYLTGYDVVTLNLADLFRGTVPQTGDLLAGDFSRPNVAFPGCDAVLPQGNLPQILIDHLQASHTGHASAVYNNLCSGMDHGDTLARGFVTVDVVRECSFLFPDEPGYFGPEGIAGYDNVLWGDYYFVDQDNGFAQGENLVRLEADPTAFGEGDYTFYARYVGADGSDGREPLATTWAVRYLNGGAFTGGTDLIGWHDSKIAMEPFPCGTLPEEGLMGEDQIVIFDEDENPNVLEVVCIWSFCPPGVDLSIFQFAATRVRVDSSDLPVPFDFGWMYFNLNDSTGGVLDPYSQGWLGYLHDATGLFSVGMGGTPLDSACEPMSRSLPVAGNVGGVAPGPVF